MDLLTPLRRRVDALGDAACAPGLRLLLVHLDNAAQHLARAEATRAATAISDAMFRVNQAFEAGMKEAGRVLLGRDPARLRVAEIEGELRRGRGGSARLASLVQTYRESSGAPVLHDPDLAVDESTAFVAYTAVAGLSCVLLDEIAEQLSCATVRAFAERNRERLHRTLPAPSTALTDRCLALLRAFAACLPELSAELRARNERPLLGALRGFVAALAPDIGVNVPAPTAAMRRDGFDLELSVGREKVAIEFKSPGAAGQISSAIARLERSVSSADVRAAILFVCPPDGAELQCISRHIPYFDSQVVILGPAVKYHTAVQPRPALRRALVPREQRPEKLPPAPVYCWLC